MVSIAALEGERYEKGEDKKWGGIAVRVHEESRRVWGIKVEKVQLKDGLEEDGRKRICGGGVDSR